MASVLCLRHSQLQTSLRELCFCSRSAQWAGVATGSSWAADAGRRLRHEMLILELLYRCVCPHARDQYLQALHSFLSLGMLLTYAESRIHPSNANLLLGPPTADMLQEAHQLVLLFPTKPSA